MLTLGELRSISDDTVAFCPVAICPVVPRNAPSKIFLYLNGLGLSPHRLPRNATVGLWITPPQWAVILRQSCWHDLCILNEA